MADDGIKRTTIRYSCVKKDHHRRAYEIVEAKTNATKNEFIIQAILEKEEGNELAELIKRAIRDALSDNLRITGIEEQIRKVVREELAHVSFVQPTTAHAKKETDQPQRHPDNAIPSDAMDFINGLTGVHDKEHL